MANHTIVTRTKIPFDTAEIDRCLVDLNSNIFKRVLQIDRCSDTEWGSVAWHILPVGKPLGRICFINDKSEFEYVHGGGRTWLWWMDEVIVNTIAEKFSGYVYDVCFEQYHAPKPIRSFKQYLMESPGYTGRLKRHAQIRGLASDWCSIALKEYWQEEIDEAPWSFYMPYPGDKDEEI